MSTHTPGPWRAVISAHGFTIEAPPKADKWSALASQNIYQDKNSACYSEAEKAANARLIAAAPDLLAELERSIEREYNPFEPDNQSAAYKRMTALYAKATGSSGSQATATAKKSQDGGNGTTEIRDGVFYWTGP